MDHAALLQELLRDEDERLLPYKDSLGILTIGIGHNLKRPISERASRTIFEDDVEEHWRELRAALPWVDQLDDVRQRVLLNMAFNLGVPALLVFKRTLDFVREGRYEDAADAMLQSLWARQVKGRAQRLAAMMRTGTT